ncbi:MULTISPECIES: helix-turn-helix domain-containing protein [Citrobacter]|uniref:helix-turn-helix domain-containing protein n=1 Tax=Citrobacter TaxID=544 RepID=UPI00103D7D76|nr:MULTISPECIES: helix-turn-helix transcriptional regulator [Citrobacter]EBA4668720.1 transcriptional regulator [Salmonella enterica]EGI9436042.1 transcriptional regulator [Salmonella enterica subsp. enterica serovar Agona]ELK6103386.1 helix-turn-helix domain-containing protein [Citrobacter freundii]EGJ8944892.1 transcriptional regulator [Salmonella enterica subsp. enterica serovar Agona]EKO2470325.1 helix-turn-helix domain-containing protein [Salmonella enterica]
MVTKSQDWHPEDIKAAIRKRGMTTSQLSRMNGLADSTLRNVFRHHWPKGEKIIAEFLGLKASDIWPSRYENTIQKAVA